VQILQFLSRVAVLAVDGYVVAYLGLEHFIDIFELRAIFDNLGGMGVKL
jgi:hypothetical protein